MPENSKPNFFGAVYLILKKENNVLFQKRSKKVWAGGYYGLPAGHIEGNETLFEALQREVKEELGITISEIDTNLVHVMHRLSDPPRIYFDFFFTAEKWDGEIKNMEPEKHDELKWFPENNLSKDTLPYLSRVFGRIKNNILFSEDKSPEIK